MGTSRNRKENEHSLAWASGIRPCARCGFVERVGEGCVRTRLSWIVLGPVAARAPQSKIFEKKNSWFSFPLFFRILDFYCYDFLELGERNCRASRVHPPFRLSELHGTSGWCEHALPTTRGLVPPILCRWSWKHNGACLCYPTVDPPDGLTAC